MSVLISNSIPKNSGPFDLLRINGTVQKEEAMSWVSCAMLPLERTVIRCCSCQKKKSSCCTKNKPFLRFLKVRIRKCRMYNSSAKVKPAFLGVLWRQCQKEQQNLNEKFVFGMHCRFLHLVVPPTKKPWTHTHPWFRECCQCSRDSRLIAGLRTTVNVTRKCSLDECDWYGISLTDKQNAAELQRTTKNDVWGSAQKQQI